MYLARQRRLTEAADMATKLEKSIRKDAHKWSMDVLEQCQKKCAQMATRHRSEMNALSRRMGNELNQIQCTRDQLEAKTNARVRVLHEQVHKRWKDLITRKSPFSLRSVGSLR
eukprot:Filipodium_phascolosomae@DN8472_c0_g1_i1.p1